MTPLRDDDRSTLASLLDALLPPSGDGRLPGAGELGLAAWVEERAREGSALERFLGSPLAALAARGLAALAPEEKLAAAKELERTQPDAFRELLAVTYGGYYQHPRVVAALGLEPRPPFPKGYTVAPSDLSLLDPVRRRAPFFRTV